MRNYFWNTRARGTIGRMKNDNNQKVTLVGLQRTHSTFYWVYFKKNLVWYTIDFTLLILESWEIFTKNYFMLSLQFRQRASWLVKMDWTWFSTAQNPIRINGAVLLCYCAKTFSSLPASGGGLRLLGIQGFLWPRWKLTKLNGAKS